MGKNIDRNSPFSGAIKTICIENKGKVYMKKRYAIKDKNLLITAQNIFGEDIVIDAWTLGWFQYEGDHSGNEDSIKDMKENIFKSISEKEIDIGCVTIALKLSNGNIITATSSEWGDISKKEYDFVEVE